MLSAFDMLLFIPTYNEKENLERLVRRIGSLKLGADILILDDHSPDGTGEVANRLVKEGAATSVIHRSGKLGIGSAHHQAIRWAYERGYKRLLTMDCDFTHSPEDIPSFLSQGEFCDVVIGTRFVDPGSLKDWDPLRKWVTYLGHFLTEKLLKIPYDASGAFRLYRLDRIPSELFDLVTSGSYSFFFQSLFILSTNGFSVREIPIVLPARTCGHSKMKVSDAAKGLWRLAVTCVDSRIRRSAYQLGKEGVGGHAQPFAVKNH